MRKRNEEECAALRKRILAELTERPQTMRDLTSKLNIGHRTSEKHFDWLKVRGLVDFYGSQNAVIWAVKAVAEVEKARIAKEKAERSFEADERRLKAKAKRMREEAKLDAEIMREKHAGGPEWKVTQRIVPAHTVKVKISGPRSVWDLAA